MTTATGNRESTLPPKIEESLAMMRLRELFLAREVDEHPILPTETHEVAAKLPDTIAKPQDNKPDDEVTIPEESDPEYQALELVVREGEPLAYIDVRVSPVERAELMLMLPPTRQKRVQSRFAIAAIALIVLLLAVSSEPVRQAARATDEVAAMTTSTSAATVEPKVVLAKDPASAAKELGVRFHVTGTDDGLYPQLYEMFVAVDETALHSTQPDGLSQGTGPGLDPGQALYVLVGYERQRFVAFFAGMDKAEMTASEIQRIAPVVWRSYPGEYDVEFWKIPLSKVDPVRLKWALTQYKNSTMLLRG